MSWLYSQALVVAFSEANCSDGELSAPSSGNPIPQAYLPPDRMTAFSHPSRFGMTFAPLTDTLGAELLTWFLAASHARTSVLPAKAQASMENAPACGRTWRELWARFDPASCSWRTLQPSLLGDSAESSPTWPRSGMTAGGQCWALPMLGRRTSGIDSGLSGVPTPRMTDWKNGKQREDFGMNLPTFAKLWPTPVASDTSSRTKLYAQGGTPLSLAVKFPTPTAHNAKEGAHPSEYERNCPTLATHAGGSLNPTWVEWLMGWPLGWTDLKPLAMDKSRSVPQRPGECSPQILSEAA